MQTLSAPLLDLLAQREKYFDRLAKDFESYGPDAQGQIRKYLPQIGVLEPSVHDMVATIYEKMRSSSRMNLPQKQEDYLRYKGIMKYLTEYIKLKKENNKPNKLIGFDIWTRVFHKAEDRNRAEKLLKASDQVEDLLWLADLASCRRLSEEDAHLINGIDKLLDHLPDYFPMIEISSNSQTKIKNLLQEIKEHYSAKDYQQTSEKTSELKTYIRV